MMEVKKNNLHVSCFFYIIFIFLYFFQACSDSDKYLVIEKYGKGNKKLSMSIIDESNAHFCYKSFFEDGELESEYCMKNFQIDGPVFNYYPSGQIESKENYSAGKRQGDFYFYNKDGLIIQYVYYFNDNPFYRKDYNYKGVEVSISEGYLANVKFETDTLFYPNVKLKFEVSLQIPDSLRRDKEFIFAYQMKSPSLKDSIIINPTFQVNLKNNESVQCSINIEPSPFQLFYGHLFEKKDKHIFYPYEHEITILQIEK